MACKGKGNDKMECYKQLFREADSDGDGFLSIVEFRNLLNRGRCKMSDSQIADSFVFFDGPKGDRRITFEEFVSGLDKIMKFVGTLRKMFDEFDCDRSGFLDRGELTKLLQKSGQNFTECEITQILKDADKNGDNEISFDELVDACV